MILFIHSFIFSQRLNNLLLQNQRYLNYLELPTTNLNTWEKYFSIIGSQIECLNINTIDLSISINIFSKFKIINYFFTIWFSK